MSLGRYEKTQIDDVYMFQNYQGNYNLLFIIAQVFGIDIK